MAQRKLWALVCAVVIVSPVFGAAPSVSLDKKIYKAEEQITATFTAPEGYPDKAWIGVVPSSVPHGSEKEADRFDVRWEYLSGRTSGTWIIPAPAKPGAWDVRLLDGQGNEVAHAAFEVFQPDYGKASLKLPATEVDPGTAIELAFTAPDGLPKSAWVGLIPASVPHGDEGVNDQHDLQYRYLTGTSGILPFTAPEKGGAYTFRMHSGHPGEEIFTIPLTVRSPDLEGAKLSIARDEFIPGAKITLNFQAPEGLSPKAWIGLVPAEIPHGSETENDRHDLAWHYMNAEREGSMEFRAPLKGGDYTFRMHNSDQDGLEIASIPFVVKASVEAKDLKAQLEEEGRVAVYGIRFATDKATINSESAQALAQIASLLADSPSLRLRIEGHTDNVGDDAYNLDLSNRRAASVKKHLVEVHSVVAGRLATQGFGESKPVSSNETATGRAQNRRVELVQQ